MPNDGKPLVPRNGAQVARPAPEPSMVRNGETARALLPNAPPRAIIQAFTRTPFKVGSRVELDPTRPLDRDPESGALAIAPGGGGLVTAAQQKELRDKGALVAPGVAAVVNRVTPEQLLAIVVSLIATSKNASEACVRLRQEVTGWRFENTSGETV